MKKYLSLMLALLLLLPGCGGKPKEDETTSQDAETILRVMLGELAEYKERDAFVWYLDPSDVDGYLTGFYKLEDLGWSDGAIVRMEGARAFELAVLRVDDESVDRMAEALRQYLLDRQGSFTGYFPDQAALAEQGRILTKGEWVALIVCEDPETAQDGFEECFGDGQYAKAIIDFLPDSEPEDPTVYQNPEEDIPSSYPPFTPPGKDDMTLFDNSAILFAWTSGDDSGLPSKDKQVLDAAKTVLAECITPDMSDYDKELALYIWLITHAEYDQSHYDPQGAPRTAYEPYGPLIDGKGVCLGYATTFQLFMDMAGIECITVVGAAFYGTEDHAWNMVRLNGNWYCVDSTWDHGGVYEATGRLRYFNVTSGWMAFTNHQWDYASVPEATAEDFGRP